MHDQAGEKPVAVLAPFALLGGYESSQGAAAWLNGTFQLGGSTH